MLRRLITFDRLKVLSFTHSAIYLGLLTASVTDRDDAVGVLGWAHGVGWILMAVLVVIGVRLRVISLRLAVLVAVVGGVGPFAGSLGFVLEERRRRGMV